MIEDVDVLIVGGGLTGLTLLHALAQFGIYALMIDEHPTLNMQLSFDARSLALAPASIAILQALGLWENISANATAIKKIHVSQQGCFGRTQLFSHHDPLGFVLELPYLHNSLVKYCNSSFDRQSDQPTLCGLSAESRMHTSNGSRGQASDSCGRSDGQGRNSNNYLQAKVLRIEDDHVVVQSTAEVFSVHAKVIVGADGTHSHMRTLCGLTTNLKNFTQAAVVTNLGLARTHHNCAYERL